MLMSEEEIERTVESRTNALDRRLMKGTVSQAEYDTAMTELNTWAERELRLKRREPQD